MTDEAESIFGRSPPPRATDTLFGASAQDWPLNACIMHYGDVDHAYKEGFRKAAFQLAGNMCEHPSDQDNLVYPIVYLYRHHTEMMLKNIFRMIAEFLEKPVSDNQNDKLGRHDLLKIWRMIRPHLNAICKKVDHPNIPSADLEGIESYMHQLNKHDPDGQSFRYARDKKMERTISADVVHINIRSFAVHMEQLADYLDGLENWLHILIEKPLKDQAGA